MTVLEVHVCNSFSCLVNMAANKETNVTGFDSFAQFFAAKVLPVHPRQELVLEPNTLGIRVLVQPAREDVATYDRQVGRLQLWQMPVKVGDGRY